MGKGNNSQSKEKKKPKADHNKKKKGAPAATPTYVAQGFAKPGMPQGGKS